MTRCSDEITGEEYNNLLKDYNKLLQEHIELRKTLEQSNRPIHCNCCGAQHKMTIKHDPECNYWDESI